MSDTSDGEGAPKSRFTAAASDLAAEEADLEGRAEAEEIAADLGRIVGSLDGGAGGGDDDAELLPRAAAASGGPGEGCAAGVGADVVQAADLGMGHPAAGGDARDTQLGQLAEDLAEVLSGSGAAAGAHEDGRTAHSSGRGRAAAAAAAAAEARAAAGLKRAYQESLAGCRPGSGAAAARPAPADAPAAAAAPAPRPADAARARRAEAEAASGASEALAQFVDAMRAGGANGGGAQAGAAGATRAPASRSASVGASRRSLLADASGGGGSFGGRVLSTSNSRILALSVRERAPPGEAPPAAPPPPRAGPRPPGAPGGAGGAEAAGGLAAADGAAATPKAESFLDQLRAVGSGSKNAGPGGRSQRASRERA